MFVFGFGSEVRGDLPAIGGKRMAIRPRKMSEEHILEGFDRAVVMSFGFWCEGWMLCDVGNWEEVG